MTIQIRPNPKNNECKRRESGDAKSGCCFKRTNSIASFLFLSTSNHPQDRRSGQSAAGWLRVFATTSTKTSVIFTKISSGFWACKDTTCGTMKIVSMRKSNDRSNLCWLTILAGTSENDMTFLPRLVSSKNNLNLPCVVPGTLSVTKKCQSPA